MLVFFWGGGYVTPSELLVTICGNVAWNIHFRKHFDIIACIWTYTHAVTLCFAS